MPVRTRSRLCHVHNDNNISHTVIYEQLLLLLRASALHGKRKVLLKLLLDRFLERFVFEPKVDLGTIRSENGQRSIAGTSSETHGEVSSEGYGGSTRSASETSGIR